MVFSIQIESLWHCSDFCRNNNAKIPSEKSNVERENECGTYSRAKYHICNFLFCLFFLFFLFFYVKTERNKRKITSKQRRDLKRSSVKKIVTGLRFTRLSSNDVSIRRMSRVVSRLRWEEETRRISLTHFPTSRTDLEVHTLVIGVS